MKLKRIDLVNFRQYEKDSVEFSTDKRSNVTLVIGEVGAGKSTLEQAFKFVMYNKTNFTKPILLNEGVRKRMPINSPVEVSVSLSFEFKKEEYLIKRSIKYLKMSTNEVSQMDPNLVGWKIVNGNNVPINDSELASLISKVIPEKLSTYFFLDGEKVETLADSLNNLGKQDDFKEVVTRLLGLEYLQSAIYHLKKDRKSVIKSLEKEADEFGDSKLVDLNGEAERISNLITRRYSEKSEIEKAIEVYRGEKIKLEGTISRIPQAQQIFKQYKELESDIESTTTEKLEEKYSFRKLNNFNFTNFLSIPLYKQIVEELNVNIDVDFGVPEINSKTIDYIEKAKKCICGEEIMENDRHWHSLEKLREYLPPNSIGTFVNNFLRNIELKLNASSGFFEQMESNYKLRRQQLTTIEAKKIEFKQLSLLLNDLNEINKKKIELDQVKENLRSSESRRDSLVKDIGQLEQEYSRLMDQIESLRTKSITSKKKLNSLKLANEISEKLIHTYSEKEAVVRKELEQKINQLEREFYREGFNISIDENYRMSIAIDGAENSLTHSTGQNNSIIFAFIGSVIDLAKKQFLEDQDNLSQEFYPLVLDAPLSNFGISVIKNFCEVMPDVVEQLILFSNDKDGDFIKKFMNDRIGKEYRIKLINLIESKIEVA